MQNLSDSTQAVSKVHFIGGEKGGVGKSMVARLIAQFLIDHQLPFVCFDTDRSHGALLRFYADYASPVLIDRYEALDRVIEAAVEEPGCRVLVDLAAQTHEPLVRWMDESGVLEMDSGRDSVDLLARLLDRFGARIQHVLVLNQLRGSDFTQLEKSGQLERAQELGARVITIKRLHESVVQKIDTHNVSFWAARNISGNSEASLGLMERQRLKMWMNHAYAELEKAGV